MGECSSSAAKTSVWWDIDKCAVPRGRCDPHRIAYNVIGALAAAGYAGPVSIAAYGDAARVAPPVLQALSATGICLTHVPAGSKDTSDKRMLVDMLFWAFDNPPPGNYLLISGDRDFSDLLHRLRMKRYNILLVRPSNASSQVLAAAAKTVWLWETLAAGDVLRPESPPASSILGCMPNVRNASGVLGCKPNVRNASGVLGCKPNVRNTSILLEIPALSKSSAQKHVLSTPTQVEVTDRSILGEMPSTSTKCVARNGTLDFGGSKKHYNQTNQHQNELRPEFRIGDNNGKASNRHKVKPFQKYVKKTYTTFCFASKQVDSVRVPRCPKGSTKTKLDQSSVSSSPPSSSFEILNEAKAEKLGRPESSTPSAKKSVASAHLHRVRAPHESIFGKKPSISVEHASRNETHGFSASTVHSHPASQQSKSSEAQNKIYPYSNVGGNRGKLSNGYKLNQEQIYVKKVDVLSASTSSPVNGFPDNPGGSPSSHPSQSMSASSSFQTLHTAKLNQSTPNGDPPFSLPSAHNPAVTGTLHQDCSGFIFGKKDGTSVPCTSPNGTFAFAVDNGHCHPTYQQSRSSLLLEQNISTIPHPHGLFGHSHSINSLIGSSVRPSAVSNGVSSAQIQAWPSGSTFQGLDDICHGFSRLNISECSQGTGEDKLLFQGTTSSDTSMGMSGISGQSTELLEAISSFHCSSDTTCFLNHSNNPQASQPLSSDYTCRNVHPPNIPNDMQNPGQHGDKTRYLPNSPDSEGTIGHILHALDILKAEKILPTESNIADCMCYGEMNLTGFDVKKALELAIRHEAVVMKKLVNDMPLFVPKDESLWKCVNVTSSKAKKTIEALDTVHKYISSSDGYSAIKNSQSRYQAATLLKKSCLQHYALGDVLQVLHIIVVRKKWLMPHSLGWQPLSLNTLVIAPTDATGKD